MEMENPLNTIRINYTDQQINRLLSTGGDGTTPVTKHYNQNEDFFLKLEDEFHVPSFPIHHDVRLSYPSDDYLQALRQFLADAIPMVPQMFNGLTYYFDPSEILRPGFFQLFKIGDVHYLYMVRVDLARRTHDHRMTARGTNDRTAEYASRKLFVDADVVPLTAVDTENNKIVGFHVHQTVSQTWIGETGRGYFVQGIWMDLELTKFFSKLFMPPTKRSYPYYPFRCKYRTICNTVISFGLEERKRHPPLLHRAMQFIAPEMEAIQDTLRQKEFSISLPRFQEIRKRVPEYWNGQWQSLAVKPYLNENDMKEFHIES